MTKSLHIRVGDVVGELHLWSEMAPKTIERLESSLPLDGSLVHCRWSGDACFTELDPELFKGVGLESAVRSLYPLTVAIRPPSGLLNSAELLISYGVAEYRLPTGQAQVTPIGEFIGDLSKFRDTLAGTALRGATTIGLRASASGPS